MNKEVGIKKGKGEKEEGIRTWDKSSMNFVKALSWGPPIRFFNAISCVKVYDNPDIKSVDVT